MKLIIKRIKDLLFRVWIRRPATKLDVINSRYDVAVLIKYVKEFETINRTDLTTLIFKLKELEKEKKEEYKKKDFKNEGGIYQ